MSFPDIILQDTHPFLVPAYHYIDHLILQVPTETSRWNAFLKALVAIWIWNILSTNCCRIVFIDPLVLYPPIWGPCSSKICRKCSGSKMQRSLKCHLEMFWYVLMYINDYMYPLVNYHSNGISACSIGHTSSIRVHVPASYVSLPKGSTTFPSKLCINITLERGFCPSTIWAEGRYKLPSTMTYV